MENEWKCPSLSCSGVFNSMGLLVPQTRPECVLPTTCYARTHVKDPILGSWRAVSSGDRLQNKQLRQYHLRGARMKTCQGLPWRQEGQAWRCRSGWNEDSVVSSDLLAHSPGNTYQIADWPGGGETGACYKLSVHHWLSERKSSGLCAYTAQSATNMWASPSMRRLFIPRTSVHLLGCTVRQYEPAIESRLRSKLLYIWKCELPFCGR